MRRFALISLVLLLAAARAAGQSNAALLSSPGQEAGSDASLSFRKDNGALIPLEGSDDAWQITASTESCQRVSERLVFHGKMAYTHFRGLHMGGPILMNPAGSPINFLEEDFTARGTKKRETYSLSGGLAYTLSRVVSLGMAADYTSADQVKYKDPRFKNVWMDLSLRPGILLNLGESFALGVNLEYRRTLEKISAGRYGTIERDFYILVDQGNYYGQRERFEGDVGYISLSNERPLENTYYGLAVQAVGGRNTRLSGQLTALYRTGYFGTRSSSSVVFCEFKGPEIAFEGSLTRASGSNLHKVEANAFFGLVSNYTNSYRYDTQVGMTATVVYLGQSKSFTKNDVDARLSYTFQGGTGGYLPKWEVKAAAGMAGKFYTTTVYPFRRDRTSVAVDATVSLGRNFSAGKNIWSCAVQGAFLTGFGEPRADSMAGGGTTTLRSFDNYSDRQFEYETAARAGAGLGLQYSRLISARLIPYIKISDQFLLLLSAPRYLDGAARNVALIGIGLHF